MLHSTPSPKSLDTPVLSPASPPLLPQEGCLSTQCSLQVESTGMHKINVTLALGIWTWSRMAQGITSLPCQTPA